MEFDYFKLWAQIDEIDPVDAAAVEQTKSAIADGTYSPDLFAAAVKMLQNSALGV